MNWDVQLCLASLSLDVRSEVVCSLVIVWDPFGLMSARLGWNVQSDLGCLFQDCTVWACMPLGSF